MNFTKIIQISICCFLYGSFYSGNRLMNPVADKPALRCEQVLLI